MATAAIAQAESWGVAATMNTTRAATATASPPPQPLPSRTKATVASSVVLPRERGQGGLHVVEKTLMKKIRVATQQLSEPGREHIINDIVQLQLATAVGHVVPLCFSLAARALHPPPPISLSY